MTLGLACGPINHAAHKGSPADPVRKGGGSPGEILSLPELSSVGFGAALFDPHLPLGCLWVLSPGLSQPPGPDGARLAVGPSLTSVLTPEVSCRTRPACFLSIRITDGLGTEQVLGSVWGDEGPCGSECSGRGGPCSMESCRWCLSRGVPPLPYYGIS